MAVHIDRVVPADLDQVGRAHSGADQNQDDVHVPGALVGKQGADFALGEHLPLAALVSVNVQ